MPASFLPDLIAGTKKRETSFFLELCAGQQYPNPKPTQKPPQTKPKPTIKPTPKIIPNQPQKQTRPQITPLRPPFANLTILFLGSTGSASTPVENIAIIGYFEKQRVLIRKKPVNVAGLQCPPF